MRKCKANMHDVSLLVPFVLLVASLITKTRAVSLKLANDIECDRYSLDAVYHEKYQRITEDILADSSEFVSRVTDLMSDSVTSVMADLPDRDSSDVEEKNIFLAFNELKKKFIRNVDKIKKNITVTWQSLLLVNHDLMVGRKNFSLEDLRNKTLDVTEMYIFSRRSLDASMEAIISPVKSIVSNGLKGINAVAATEVRKERKKKEKERKEGEEDEKEEEEEKEEEKEKEEKQEERMKENELDKKEIYEQMKKTVKTLVPGFLGKVSSIVLERKINLKKKIEKKSEDRDSVFDDLCFNLAMVRNRVTAILHEDLPRSKEGIDLGRRNIYIYWTQLATSMYKERIEDRRGAPSGETKESYRRLWADEEKLADTLVSLMEVYP